MIVLNYHHVGFPTPEFRYKKLFIRPDYLRHQIRLLKALGFNFQTLAQWCQSDKNARTVCLTFDDGFLDNFENGLPILQKENVPATVFCVTGDVGQKNFRWKESGETAASDFLNWDQLKKLIDSGWEIGSHSSEHVHHSKLHANQQFDLIAKSYHDIKNKLGVHPVSFAYPYGDFNPDTIHATRTAGFEIACTTRIGSNSFESDLFQIKRIPLGGYKFHHLVKSDFQLIRYSR